MKRFYNRKFLQENEENEEWKVKEQKKESREDE